MGRLGEESRKSHAYSSVLVIGYDKYPPNLIYHNSIRGPMSVTRLAFQLGPGTNQIDLARALSAHQRTLIHQKQIFTVLGGMVVDNPTDNQSVEISTAPNTWYTRTAVNRLFKSWKRYRSKTLSLLSESVQPSKYSDFKILLNSEPAGSIALPITRNRNALNGGEWIYSSMINEAGTEKFMQIVGGHGITRYSATKGWIQTTAIPQLSDPVMANIDGIPGPDYELDFLETLHETDDEIDTKTEQIVEDNDEAPFNRLLMYGDDIDEQNDLQTQYFTYVSANNPNQMIPGFKALCGLVQVEFGSGVSQPILYLDVLNTPEDF